jgi:Flp pilus assembly protein TadG
MMASVTGSRRRGKRCRGAVAVEAAVVLPVLVTLLTAIWEVGRLVQVQQLVHNAAREAGRQASTGRKDTASVQADALRYLQRTGLKSTAGTTVTVTNLSGPADTDPTLANQLDHYRVTVTLPFNAVRWIFLNQITSAQTITSTSDWYSMKDVPVVVTGSIPIE